MKNPLIVVARQVVILTAAVVVSVNAAAQGVGSIVESQGVTLGQANNSSSTRSAPPVNNDALSLLLEQNQQLQAEVQALRGLVEQQGFEIRRLQRDSLNRYTNLDERLTSLESNPSSVAATPPVTPTPSTSNSPANNAADPTRRPIVANSSSTTTNTTASGNSGLARNSLNDPVPARTNSRPTLEPAVLSEQQLYQMAYDSVINSNFERSIAEFDQYLSIYPQGLFLTNAHYWKGQAYLYLDRFEEARQSYEIIIDDYPDSPKLPDAMYGLGLAYEGMGNISQARQILNNIKRRFPNTGVANLADTRLLSLD